MQTNHFLNQSLLQQASEKENGCEYKILMATKNHCSIYFDFLESFGILLGDLLSGVLLFGSIFMLILLKKIMRKSAHQSFD